MAATPRSSSQALATLYTHLRRTTTPVPAAADADQPAALRHIVCFRFSPSAADAQKTALVEAFTALPNAIPAILDFEFSLNTAGNKYEEVGQGFTHCFWCDWTIGSTFLWAQLGHLLNEIWRSQPDVWFGGGP